MADDIKSKKIKVKQQLIAKIKTLNSRLESLSTHHTNIIQAFITYVMKIWLKLQIRFNQITFNSKIEKAVENLVSAYNEKNKRYQFIISKPEDAVTQSCSSQLQELDRVNGVIDQIKNSIYGALGEQKVVEVLEKLDDDCFLINDFNHSFQPAIYNKNEKSYIQSVQIDHILVTRAGIFLIETKNWSQQSLNNLSLFSPVQQIKRVNFALYKMLNEEVLNRHLGLRKHHWGDRKISIRNLVVLTNHKPNEEFQFVKILTLNELLKYVNYFEPSYSREETQMIANHLLSF